MVLLKYFIHPSLENLHFCSELNSPYKKKGDDQAERISGWPVEGYSSSQAVSSHSDTLLQHDFSVILQCSQHPSVQLI